MIAYIRGKVTHKTQTELVLETKDGMGYEINISLQTYNQLPTSTEIRLFTYFAVKEDSQQLYGFWEMKEKRMFEQLLSVSGVGANTARLMLSTLSPEELQSAIVGEQVNILKGVKGIGPKSAKRIILELKDKLLKEGISVTMDTLPADNEAREEALAALVALGFNKSQAQKALNRVLKSQPGISESGVLLKAALQQLR